MTKYYRFISEAEYQALMTNETVEGINNRPLFVLPEKPTTYILPNELNYNLTVEELLASNYPQKTDFTKEVFMAYMTGTVSENYLVELNLPSKPAIASLGWYYNDDETELCLVEYCVSQYSLDQITNIYTGNFYSWTNIDTVATKMSIQYDSLLQEKDNPNATPSLALDVFRQWDAPETDNIAFKEWVIAIIDICKNETVNDIIETITVNGATFDI